LRALKLDISVDPQGLTKSALVAWLSGAKRRIGFGDEKGRELSQWLNTELVSTAATHVIDCNLALLRPLGLARPKVEFRVPMSQADAAFAEELAQTAGVEGGYAVINPGAGWRSKIWPAERYGAVADYLGRYHGLPSLVVWAGGDERTMAAQIVDCSGGYAQLAPPTSLLQLAAVLHQATLCIGSDTGPLHLAVAVGTLSVSLYGTTSPERNGPYGPDHSTLRSDPVETLHRKRKTATNDLIKKISVERVCQACDQILPRCGWDAAA
jgi:ADP-heptose:LPS heptosyltransferase